jgi:hypothetical protein
VSLAFKIKQSAEEVPKNLSSFPLLIFPTILLLFILSGCSSPERDHSYIGSSQKGVYARIPFEYSSMNALDFLKLKNPNVIPPQGYYGIVFSQGIIETDNILWGEKLSGVLVTQSRPLQNDGSPIIDDVEAQYKTILYDIFDLKKNNDPKFKLLIEDVSKRGDEVVRHLEFTLGVDGDRRHIVQQTVLSADGKKVAAFALGCTEACFKDNQIQINSILQDWRSSL